jgi:hypothetical protein
MATASPTPLAVLGEPRALTPVQCRYSAAQTKALARALCSEAHGEDQETLSDPHFDGIGTHTPTRAGEMPAPPAGYAAPSVITTPINADAVEVALRQHPNREQVKYVVAGLRTGFDLGFGQLDGKVLRANTNCERNKQSMSEEEALQDTLREVEEDVAAGRVTELDPATSRAYCTPLDRRPKSNGKFRIIQNLSFPKQDSPNDTVDSEQYHCRYPKAEFAAAAMRTLGARAWAVVVDVKGAFRLMPVHASQRYLLGFMLGGRLFVHNVAPFGGRATPAIWETLAQLVQWILRQRIQAIVGRHAITHYLDDFLVILDSQAAAEAALAVVLETLASLRIPAAPQKLQMAEAVDWIGMRFDFASSKISIMPERKERLREAIKETLAANGAKVKDLAHLTHSFKWCTATMEGARCWVTGLEAKLRGRSNKMAWAKLSRRDAFELETWNRLLDAADGREQRVMRSCAALVSDASGVDGAGCFLLVPESEEVRWCCFKFPAHILLHRTANGSSSGLLEVYGALAGLIAFGPSIQGRRVTLVGDNEGMSSAWAKFRSRTRPINSALRAASLWCTQAHLQIRSKHLGRDNNLMMIADALSHFDTTLLRANFAQVRRVEPRLGVLKALWA